VRTLNVHEVELRATVIDHRQGPREPFPQIAFAGRSNVGKSSLLNTLFGMRIAGVSKTPGKTRTINYYLVNRRLYFVDLPGYGYARVERSQRQSWGKSVTAYLAGEDRLTLVVGLVDPRVPTTPLDLQLGAFVRSAGRRLQVVLTKADKLGRGALAQAAARVRHDLELDHAPLTFSARTGSGRTDILAAIAQALAA
jgi:GTP-binding protein